jgi:UDP-2,4-diacetamido-2,4,6-trideoxy-beta-L-altropyranose hydrolase
MTAALPIIRDRAAPIVVLRRARHSDCQRVWDWNFAPDVRAQSRDPRSVTYPDHERWFERKLADLAGRIWIVEDGGVATGVVRLDRIDPMPGGAARISIALGSQSRGRGIGRRAIAAACAAWNAPVIAEIRTTNDASRAAFLAAGFELVTEADGLATFRWEPGR